MVGTALIATCACEMLGMRTILLRDGTTSSRGRGRKRSEVGTWWGCGALRVDR
jgi:hypothetical protein